MEPDSSVDSAAHVELLAAIGWALTEISAQDVGALPSDGELTVFHASGQSVISILDYVMRIASFINCSFECYVVAVIFLDRLLAASPHVRFGPYTAHRLIITAVVLAVKSIDDEYYRNAYYAHVGGIPTPELNRMEVEFLVAMQYNLYVSEKDFAAYRERLRWYMIESTLSVDANASRSPLTTAPQTWPRTAGECDYHDATSALRADEEQMTADARAAPLAVDAAEAMCGGAAGVPSHVAASVAVIDSPRVGHAGDGPLLADLCGARSEEATRRAETSHSPGGAGDALRAWVEAGCAPLAVDVGGVCGGASSLAHTGTPASVDGTTDSLAWGADAAWPPAPWDGGWPADPWALPLDGLDAERSAPGVSRTPHCAARAARVADAQRDVGGFGIPALTVPAELAVPFAEPAPPHAHRSVPLGAVGSARGTRRLPLDADAPMRAGVAGRDADVSDWAAQYGLLGVIAA